MSLKVIRAGFVFLCCLAQQHRTICGGEQRFIPPPRDGPHSQNFPRLVERVDPILDITAEDRRLILGISRSRTRPSEFEIGVTHSGLNNAVDQPLHPAEEGGKPFFEGCLLSSLGRSAIDLRGKGRRRQRKCVADYPRQPLVELVLVWSLFKSLVFGAARTPDEASAVSRISGEDRVEPLLKLADLLRAPPVWCIK